MGAAVPFERRQDMAVHLSIGRTLSVSLVALVGLAIVSGVVHYLNSPGSEVQTVPGPKSTATAPQSLVEPSSPPKKVVPIPTRAPRGNHVATLFEKGVEIKFKRDASVYLTPRNIPKNDRFLKTYDADNAARNGANAAPGLLGIAAQTYRTQGGAGAAENKAYSLADAMYDAVWRKNTSAKLDILMSQRRPLCANDAENSAAATPSIGLRITC